MKRNILFIALLITMASCSNQKSAETKATVPVPVKDSTIAKAKFTADMVDNKKDFACGMPVTAGIEDTCHYKGKVYGFCSTECKDEFLKSPAVYLSKK